jgi:hypothetical protein
VAGRLDFFAALAMTESGEVIAAYSPGGDALLIGAGRDNGRFCAYILSAPGDGPSTSHSRCSARAPMEIE